ncbi:phage tail protein [Desulfotomaculum sp. 1211_IL3151]|uniref:hyaluronate lyase N-terminal domain-containing protein n=1 Tax=Desulfotomaculum sp. 1211_IL3151 TaxID=3084055 RepID=UPI002FD99720
MARKVLIQIRRGLERDIGTLAVGELGYCTDTQKLYIGAASGNVLLVTAQTAGDMLKSIYDTNNNGKIDAAETADSAPWAGITGKPSAFTPAAHNHEPTNINQNTNNRFVTDIEKASWNGKQDALGFAPVNKAGDTVEGKLTLPTGTTAEASLTIPHGVAPTIPVNGDVWTTTSGLYLRLNGTTRTIAHTASWSTISQTEAEAGTATSQRLWTAQRVKQAIDANAMPKGPLTWNQLRGV